MGFDLATILFLIFEINFSGLYKTNVTPGMKLNIMLSKISEAQKDKRLNIWNKKADLLDVESG